MPCSVSSLVNRDGPAPLFDVRIDRVSTFDQSETSYAGTWSEKRNATHATKTGGNFLFCCFVFFQEPWSHYGSCFYFTWRLANPNKNKIIPQAVFWCFFQGCSRPKAEPQSKEKTIGVGSLGLLLTFFSLKTLKNVVLRTTLFRPNNIKILILIFLGCQIG